MSRAAVILVLLAGVLTAQVQCLGPNLVPNAGFEAGTEEDPLGGWRPRNVYRGGVVGTDDEIAVEGERAARVDVLVDGAVASLASPPIPVEGGATYLVALSFRQRGFAPEDREKYSGVSSHPRIDWLDAERKTVGRSLFLSRFPYAPSPWDLRDALETAPATARFAVVSVHAANHSVKHLGRELPSTLWVDAVQLRRYSPPPTPAWATGPAERVVEGGARSTPVLTWFAAGEPFRGQGGQWSHVVVDDRAERGTALEAQPDSGQGLMAHGPYYPYLPVGLGIYRLQIRAAVGPEAGEVGKVDVTSQRSGTRLVVPIVGRPDSGDYTVYQGDFILRDNGWWCPRIATAGERAWRIDYVRVIPILPLTDRELLDIFPASAAQVPADLEPATYRQILGGHPDPRNVNRTFVVAGFGFDRWQLPEAIQLLQRDSRCEVAWLRRGGRSTVIEGLPEDPADLFANSAIVLLNVPMNSIPLGHKRALHEYVRRGGALLVFGGHQAYGRGAWRGSLVAETMPVVPAAGVSDDVSDLGNGARLNVGDTADGLLDWLPGRALPWVRYLHRVELRPGARVFLAAGGDPVAVGGDFGDGRVVCVCAWPAGALPADRPPFWDWPHLPHLLRDLTWWALKYPDQAPEDAITH